MEQTDGEILLEMNHVKKSFDGNGVLEDISLTVKKGEVVSIIGPSGSGKSTLLRCATLLEKMDGGELIYLGQTAASEKTLDRLAGLLKSYPDARFLITGYTDARGSSAYNTDLSNRRSKRVYEALLERGVPAAMLKWHGIGKRASIIPVAAGNSVREGDRKVLLERITNMKYWEAL